MNGQQLKNSILQWAIQGKLVPQDPSEGTAEDLLKDIRAEKEQLVKAGKIKLSKPERNIKCNNKHDLEIPKSWVWCTLSDVCRVFGRIGFRGYTKSDLVKDKEGAISISPSNMKDGRMDYNNCTYISWAKYDESPEIKVEDNDILIVKTGSSYGKSVVVKNLPWKSTINPQIAIIKNISIDIEYLNVVLNSAYCRSLYEEFVLGTSIPTFSQLNLLSMNIPLPPLSEQHRIVAKIEELMPLVEKYGKSQEKLDKLNEAIYSQLEKSILQEAIQGKLVPQIAEEGTADALLADIRAEKERLVKEGKLSKKDLVTSNIYKEDDKWFETTGKETTEITEDIPFEIPDGWRFVKLEDITYSVGSKCNQIQSKAIKGSGSIPVVSQGNKLIDGYSDEIKKKISDLPIVLFGDHTRNVKYIDFEFVIGADGTKLHKPIVMDSKYLYYWMSRTALTLRDRGYARHYTLLRECYVPLPPLPEQHRIVAKIEELMKVIKK